MSRVENEDEFLVAKRACSKERITDGKVMLFRIVSMLTKLVDRFNDVGQVREDPVEYVVDSE